LKFRPACGAWVQKPRAWWCAQQLPLAALAMHLRQAPPRSLPKYVLIIDDDTVLNPCRLKDLVARLGPDQPEKLLYGGFSHGHFIAGGGGVLLSRAVLRRLQGTAGPDARTTPAVMPVDYCVHKQRHDQQWCSLHSDWAEAMCIKNATGARATNMDADFAQYQPSCNMARVTCHHQQTVWQQEVWFDQFEQDFLFHHRREPPRFNRGSACRSVLPEVSVPGELSQAPRNERLFNETRQVGGQRGSNLRPQRAKRHRKYEVTDGVRLTLSLPKTHSPSKLVV